MKPLEIGPREAGTLGLMVIDLQRDFMPGGVLGVAGADGLLPVANHYIDRFHSAGRPVVLTRDWHPPDHYSFREFDGPWPAHCVAGTPGSMFARGLSVPPDAIVVSKGTNRVGNGYSAFEDEALGPLLRERGIAHLWIAGVATDYCVRATALDALASGFAVTLLVDAMAAVDAKPGDGDRAIEEILGHGARAHAWPRPARRRVASGSAVPTKRA